MVEQQTIKYAPQWNNMTVDNVVKKELGKIAINLSYLDKTPVLKNSFPVAWRILFTFMIQVLGGNYSFTGQVNSIQQLLAYSLITGTEVDIGEIIYSDLVTKLLNKSRLKYVSYPRFISCALQVLLGPDHTLDKNFSVSTSFGCKAKKGKSQTMTSTLPQSQGPEASGALSKKSKRPKSKNPPTETKRDIQLASTGLPFTLNEGTHKSKYLPESTATHSQDSEGNKQPLDRDITFMTTNEGTTKTMPYPEGSLGDKDSGGNKPPTDMKPLHTTDVDLSRTGAKYQEDQTQSSRLRYQSLTENKGEPSYKGESDTQPIILSYADGDKPTSPTAPHTEASDIDSSSDNILKKYDDTLPLTERQLVKYLRKVSHVLFERITKDHTTITDLYKGLEVITQLLKDIKNLVKDDPAANKKIKEAFETLAKISTHTTKILSLVRSFDFSTLLTTLKNIQDHAFNMSSLHEETSSIKSLMTKMYNVFRGQSSSAPFGNLGIHTKEAVTSKAGELVKKAQDAEHETVSSRLKPEPITNLKIHPKTKPVVITVYRGTDGRNFDVLKPFLFGAFVMSNLDELREIIPKKKNTMVKELMNSLIRSYERLTKIPGELGILSALPAPKQAQSQTSG
nr:hypothetical protein [Tanacetum cinerariifolium]